jgi:hypothetical protein
MYSVYITLFYCSSVSISSLSKFVYFLDMEGEQTAKVRPLTPIPVPYKKRVKVAAAAFLPTATAIVSKAAVTVEVDAFDLLFIDAVAFDTVAVAVVVVMPLQKLHGSYSKPESE